MKNKSSRSNAADPVQPYVMAIADMLSDDPLLVDLLGPSFKVIANYDVEARRVTYSFRCVNDTAPDEWDARRA